MANYTDVRYVRPQLLLLTNLWSGRHPAPRPADAAGRFSSASEVGMLSPTELGRRITSAQDRLRAARRDGRFDDIVTWRDELDALLDLVHSMPDRHAMNRYRKYGFEIVVVEPGFDECMRRATLERTPRQQAIVHDWYVRRGLTV